MSNRFSQLTRRGHFKAHSGSLIAVYCSTVPSLSSFLRFSSFFTFHYGNPFAALLVRQLLKMNLKSSCSQSEMAEPFGPTGLRTSWTFPQAWDKRRDRCWEDMALQRTQVWTQVSPWKFWSVDNPEIWLSNSDMFNHFRSCLISKLGKGLEGPNRPRQNTVILRWGQLFHGQ